MGICVKTRFCLTGEGLNDGASYCPFIHTPRVAALRPSKVHRTFWRVAALGAVVTALSEGRRCRANVCFTTVPLLSQLLEVPTSSCGVCPLSSTKSSQFRRPLCPRAWPTATTAYLFFRKPLLATAGKATPSCQPRAAQRPLLGSCCEPDGGGEVEGAAATKAATPLGGTCCLPPASLGPAASLPGR